MLLKLVYSKELGIHGSIMGGIALGFDLFYFAAVFKLQRVCLSRFKTTKKKVGVCLKCAQFVSGGNTNQIESDPQRDRDAVQHNQGR